MRGCELNPAGNYNQCALGLPDILGNDTDCNHVPLNQFLFMVFLDCFPPFHSRYSFSYRLIFSIDLFFIAQWEQGCWKTLVNWLHPNFSKFRISICPLPAPSHACHTPFVIARRAIFARRSNLFYRVRRLLRTCEARNDKIWNQPLGRGIKGVGGMNILWSSWI